jgi:hypothetical protein
MVSTNGALVFGGKQFGSPSETKGISLFGDTGKSIDSKWATQISTFRGRPPWCLGSFFPVVLKPSARGIRVVPECKTLRRAKPKSNRRYAVWRDTIVIARCITITVHTARARWIRVMNIHAKRCEQRDSRTASPEHQF